MNHSHPEVTAVVTGGASGIGLCAVQSLLDQGRKVAVIDIDEAALHSLLTSHPEVATFSCDLSDQLATESTIAAIKASCGVIDLLVHCAAIMPGADLADMDAATINKVMTVNFSGTVNISKAVLTDMLERDAGSLVVIGSMAGSVLTHGLGAYSASKAATNTYIEVLQEENRSNVHIMLVNPPMVNTPLLEQAVDKGPASMASAISSGQMVTPESIISAVNDGLLKKARVVYPGHARFMMRLRRFAPSLLWWVMRRANKR